MYDNPNDYKIEGESTYETLFPLTKDFLDEHETLFSNCAINNTPQKLDEYFGEFWEEFSKKINSKLLSFWGRNTLIIMATHQLILTMFSKINIVNELNFITKLILVLVIEYPIIVLINNYTPFLLGKLKKKYKLNKETIQEI